VEAFPFNCVRVGSGGRAVNSSGVRGRSGGRAADSSGVRGRSGGRAADSSGWRGRSGRSRGGFERYELKKTTNNPYNFIKTHNNLDK